MKKFTIYERRIDDEYVWEVCLTSNFKPYSQDSWFGGSRERLGEFDTVEELSALLYNSFPDYYTDEEDAYEEDGRRLFNDYCRED
jgi:hypothetical protein